MGKACKSRRLKCTAAIGNYMKTMTKYGNCLKMKGLKPLPLPPLFRHLCEIVATVPSEWDDIIH